MNKGIKKKSKSPKKKALCSGVYIRLLKCAVAGCVITVILVLFLALLLKWNVLPESATATITSVIKALCSAFVGLLCADGIEKRGWVIAGMGGVCYIIIAFISFSAVERVFSFNLGLIADLVMGFAAGAAGSLLLKVKGA